MQNRQVDVDSLKMIVALLSNYEKSLIVHTHKLKKAAEDCKDNMGGDALSMEAVKNLNECLPGFYRCCKKVELFRQEILLEIQKIEDAGNAIYVKTLRKY